MSAFDPKRTLHRALSVRVRFRKILTGMAVLMGQCRLLI
jgi:hypothetical protein